MLARIPPTFNNLRADFFMPFSVILIRLYSLCPNLIFKLSVKEREKMNSYMTLLSPKLLIRKNFKGKKFLEDKQGNSCDNILED